MINKAKEKGVKNLLLSDARFLPFKDNVFDAAVSVHLLHLIKTWQAALREICRTTQRFMVSLYYAKKDMHANHDNLLRSHHQTTEKNGC